VNDTSGKSSPRPLAAIIGGGPAGLMVAERLAATADVHIFDAMPSLGRKFLLAGKSGLNITHGEEPETFLTRFGKARALLEPALAAFAPDDIRAWAAELRIETFKGSSGRVFPVMMKASPLLRAWLRRLGDSGVTFHPRHKWQGWTGDGALRFGTPAGEATFTAAATVLALGGASWPRLGADGSWTPFLSSRGVEVAPFRPSNCGFDIAWSDRMKERFAGAPVKSVVLAFAGESVKGDVVVTENGIEGSAVYALSAALRNAMDRDGQATLTIDLAPDMHLARLEEALAAPRGKNSVANHLRKKAHIDGVKAALLRETADKAVFESPSSLARAIKQLPLRLERPRPIAEAISAAGGVPFGELDESFMLKKCPGVFAAGEMLDWEAPTGGYLISACLATGRAAGDGAVRWLKRS